MPEPDLTDLTVRWLDAILSSASVDTIGVTNWWPRATAALTTAAATADTYGHAVTVACHKLQIDVLAKDSAKTLADLEPQITPHLGEWRQTCERDAVYLVALTRIHRDKRKKTSPAKPASREEAMF